MANKSLEDTIVAISTPIGEGGIGIVRLSGRDSLKIADSVFMRRNGKRPSRFKTYTLHYGHIVDSAGRIIDEVILTIMRGPKSYTKEDIVEINCHSGIVPLRKILNLVLKKGARIAEPGEFTKRAFLNGRLDITQAESVLDIIKSKTDLSLKASVNNLKGALSKKVSDIRDELVDILAYIEASIDFSEEDDVDKAEKKGLINRLKRVKKDIENLAATAGEGKILRQGMRTVICGSPNVGKSSLMNALLKDSRSIVTHIPGTTRDTIEEAANIKGMPLVLVDTAGINETDHPIEKEGVRRSQISLENADLILFVLDYSRPLNRNDKNIARTIKNRDNVILVINKNDLKKRIDLSGAKRLMPKAPIAHISAINLSGIARLENTLKSFIFKGKAPTPDVTSISNDRQLDALRRSLEDIESAMTSYKDRIPMDCIAVYVRSAIENIGEVTGHTITEEALDRIFSEFCIGK